MYKYFENYSIEEIIQALEDVYEWEYFTGVLNDNSILHKMALDRGYDERDIADELVDYGCTKFKNIVTLLFLEQPYRFIK